MNISTYWRIFLCEKWSCELLAVKHAFRRVFLTIWVGFHGLDDVVDCLWQFCEVVDDIVGFGTVVGVVALVRLEEDRLHACLVSTIDVAEQIVSDVDGFAGFQVQLLQGGFEETFVWLSESEIA